MSGKEVDNSQKISNVTIHVERVIGRICKFQILQSTMPILQVHLLDNVMSVIAALVNVNSSVVSNLIQLNFISNFIINWNLYFVEWSLCFISFCTFFYKNQEILLQPGVFLFFWHFEPQFVFILFLFFTLIFQLPKALH